MDGIKLSVANAGPDQIGVHLTIAEKVGKTYGSPLTPAMRKKLGIKDGPLVVFDIDERGTLVGIEVV